MFYGKKVHCSTAISERDWGYLAGILDGEGSIMALSRKPDKRYIRVRVGMCDSGAVVWLGRVFAGSVYVQKHPAPRRNAHIWELNRQVDVQYLLSGVTPYLKVKREQSERALAWLDDPTDRTWDFMLGMNLRGR